MNLQPSDDDELDINITPLIDVVFLLLIFFMVSTTFTRQSQINLSLPQASEEVVAHEIEKVEVAVDADGRYYINHQALVNAQMTTIKQGISNVAGVLHDPVIVVSADAGAAHQSVVKILDAARQLGYVRITFATTIEEEESE
jgi:biopolymer transport protein ExbD